MPLFRLTLCAIWRQRELDLRKPTAVLSVASKPASYLHLQYNLLPTAFYKTCSLSVVNWGGVAKLQTDDGCSSALAPIIHGQNVSTMVAQVEHDISINQDGMLDLLHHKVDVVITENKEAVPSSIRGKRPMNVEVVGMEGVENPLNDVTMATPIVERATGEEMAGESNLPDLSVKEKTRKKSAPSASADDNDDEPQPGLARPIPASLTAVPSSLSDRQFSPLVSTADQQVTPIPDQTSKPSSKTDKQSKGSKGKSSMKKGQQKKQTPDKKRNGSEQTKDKNKSDATRQRKPDKSQLVLTFNMDFFFSGTDQLVMTSLLEPDAAGLVQVCLVLRAPAFLPPPQRVALNPLVVHLRRLEGMPPLPTGFGAGGASASTAADSGGESAASDVSDEEGGRRRDRAEPPVFFVGVRMPDGRVYLTEDVSYGLQVTLNHLTVVFCGLVEPELLWERMQTEPLCLEFFWRHTTPLVSNRRFNQMEIDRYIHDPNLVNIIKESGNPFALQNPLPTKFAEVLVDMSPLTRSARLLSLEVPLSAQAAEAAGAPGADIERGTCPPPFRPLQLLESEARLRLTVSLAVPLDCLPRPAPARAAYGRLLAVLTARGLQRSGVLGVVQQLNELPADGGGGGGPARPPGDVSTPGVSGFCLRDRQLHLLFAEGRADADLLQVWAALRALPRRDCRLCYHSGLLFAERLYGHRPALRVLDGRPLRPALLTTRFYTAQKREERPRAVRGLGECFRARWMSDVLRQSLLPSEASLAGLQELLAA